MFKFLNGIHTVFHKTILPKKWLTSIWLIVSHVALLKNKPGDIFKWSSAKNNKRKIPVLVFFEHLLLVKHNQKKIKMSYLFLHDRHRPVESTDLLVVWPQSYRKTPGRSKEAKGSSLPKQSITEWVEPMVESYKSANPGAAQTSLCEHLPFSGAICGPYFEITVFASLLDRGDGYLCSCWTCTRETLTGLCTRFCSSTKRHGENHLEKNKSCPTEPAWFIRFSIIFSLPMAAVRASEAEGL